MPARLSNGAFVKKNVSRLEFQAIDQPETVSVQDVELYHAFTVAESRLQEQVAALENQLKLQTEQFVADLEAVKKEVRHDAEIELREQVAIERAQVTRICEEFGRERSHYFASVETEVVKLALAIAERVLHREAKLDPLLLTAVVRVALEKVADSSTTVLRVPASEVERWREAIATGALSEVQLAGDDGLGTDQCVLETNVGRVELGVSAQLEEIEKGFFDLLQQRPA